MMALLRKVFAPLGLATLAWLLLEGGQWLKGAPYGLLPGSLLKVLGLVPLLPALVVQFWCELHLKWQPPLLPLGWLLFAFYIGMLRTARTRLTIPLKPGRRAFLAGGGVVAVSGYGVARAYPAPGLLRFPLPLPDLPPSLDGLRVVLVSDLHRGPAIGQAYLLSVVEQVNALKPDLILMPGDFISQSSVYYGDIAAALSRLRPTIASLATLGNHDHWEGETEALACLEKAGVVALHNRSVVLTPDRRLSETAETGLGLAGVDDLGAGRPDLAAALRGSGPDLPTLLMSHNPDMAEHPAALASSQRVDLQLSGHTHGGQVVLPGVGPVVSGSRFGLKYLAGWAQGPRWPVFVTRGVGASLLPLRVGAAPEIVLFELRRRD